MNEMIKTYNLPQYQDFHIEGVKHITPQNAYEAVKNGEAIMLDVREENEWNLETTSLEDVYYQLMSVIMDRLKYIPNDKAIIVVCPAGVRTCKATDLLNLHSFKDVANLDGGLMIWKAQGLPFESNLSIGCGCGCR